MALKSLVKGLQSICTANRPFKALSGTSTCLRNAPLPSMPARCNISNAAVIPPMAPKNRRGYLVQTPEASINPSIDFAQSPLPAYKHNRFESLVGNLSDILGPRFGIDSDKCDVAALMSAMRAYESHQSEWQRYALVDRAIPYTRNLVDKGNGRSNLLLLVWNPGQGSPIHDHADAHCIMKVLSGHLKEELYEYPENSDQVEPLKLWRESLMAENQVAYMSDKLGIHRMVNPDPHRLAVSLHLYTPPKVELFGCNMFDLQGNRKTVSTCGFYSEYGVRN